MSQKIRTQIAARHLQSVRGDDVKDAICVSQGICAGIPDGWQKLWDFLSAADHALYHVKKKNGNRIRMVTA